GPAAAPPQPPSLAPTAAPATIVAVPSSSNDQPCRGAASPAPPPPVSVQAAFDALMAQKREEKSWGLDRASAPAPLPSLSGPRDRTGPPRFPAPAGVATGASLVARGSLSRVSPRRAKAPSRTAR